VIVADLRHMTANWDARPWRIVATAVVRSPFYPALRAMMWVRTSMWLWRHGLRLPAHWCKARAVRAAGVEVHPGARIGPGFAFVHSVGIVVGKDVVAGRDLVLYQGVTVGHGGQPREGQPRFGGGVRVGAGAKILGPVTVGDGARIGANAVVLADVPSHATVTGIWKGEEPAR
jgi:serine O-acetyltransferase